ncbi:DUF1735 domain-containing protein [Maribacter arenosus]|uniref:DUF1735 domain-containing protein n=1 Tax=Maribacter arenosus TaxID=1854708 RepID=A0ABR7VAG8_9FLAO|nr:DUF1735 domain-containing protein [Maribacter arenosus]MBD0850670.1 hypothetical protein [Maribacter arenosus]
MMKNIFKRLTYIALSGVLLVSCDWDNDAFSELSNSPDPNATYYVQFKDASKSLESGVTESGDLIDIETTVIVNILGLPQAQDITVNLTLDPASTIDESMYNLSASAITIPAGSAGGSVTLTTNTELMPVGEVVDLILNLDAGANSATAGLQLNYSLLRIEFCPLENGTVDLVGSYTATIDLNGYPDPITAVLDAENLLISGLGVNFIENFWAEAVTTSVPISAEIAGNGGITIPRQYIYTTTYEGAPYDYEIEGTGKWENCDGKPVMIIDYDIYYPGDDTGLAATYFPTYLASPTLGGTFTMN